MNSLRWTFTEASFEKVYGWINKLLILLIVGILPIVTGRLHVLSWLAVLICNFSFILIYIYENTKRNLDFNIKINIVEISLFIWLVWNVFVFVFFLSGISELVKTFAVITTFFVMSKTKWSSSDFTWIKLLCALYLLSWTVYYPSHSTSGYYGHYSAYYSNSNLFGMIAFNCFIPFLILPFKHSLLRYVLMTISVTFIYLSGSRTVLLQLLLFIVLYAFFNYLWKKKKGRELNSQSHFRYRFSFKLPFLLILSFVVLFSIAYPYLGMLPVGEYIDEFSLRLFNKSFFSGRNIIWQNVLSVVRTSPLIGKGLTAQIFDFVVMYKLSAHSLYMQLALQTGIIGVVLTIALFFSLFKYFFAINGKYSVAALALLISVILREMFEISLTQNLLLAGISFWLYFGLGANKQVNQIKKES